MCGAGLQPGTFFTRSSIFQGFFYTLETPIFQERLRVFLIHFCYCNVSSKNLLFLFLCFFKKSDTLYLFPTNWLLLIVINKLTKIEFAPFSLFTKGAFVTFRKICLCVKSHSFIFSLIPCYPLFFKTERTISLIFALIDATYFADQINLRF